MTVRQPEPPPPDVEEPPPETGEVRAADAARLSGAAVRGVFWAGSGQVTRQLIRIPTAIVLARLLTPRDFGIVGMGLVFVAVAQLIADSGIGAALVQSRKPDPRAVASSFWANLGIALTLALALAASSDWIAGFYGDPAVGPVVLGLSLGLVIAAMITVPRALLHRAMDFRSDSKAQVAGALAGAVAAIGAAIGGAGVWSLVLQTVVENLVTLIFTSVSARWWPRMMFSFASLRGIASFSAGVLGSNLLSYATRNADNLLIGKFLGSGPLGYYSLAYRLLLYPLNQVSGVIGRVLFPTLSTLQSDLTRFRKAYLLSVQGIATLTFPMSLGLFAVSHDFVLVVFGEKWLPMETVLRVLCLIGALQSIGTTVGTIYLSTGRTRLMFLVTLAFTPPFLLSFVIGLRWGIEGVAIAYASVSAALFYVSLGIVLRIVRLSFLDFHRALIGPCLAALAMLAAVTGTRLALEGTLDTGLVRLLLLVAVGVATYGMASMVFNRRHVLELVHRARTGIAGARP
jgi:PST family polysaccharide transporter